MTVGDHELTLDGGLLRLESALSSVTHTDAQLALLARGMKHLAASANAARDANAELTVELDGLRAHLSQSYQEEQALRFRLSQLEQLLDVVRRDSARERAFLIEQQDLFLVEILSDHDRQIVDLQGLLHGALLRTEHSRELAELTAQRDQAREYATRCERERDAAWHELATGYAPAASEGPAAGLRRRTTPPPLPLPADAAELSSSSSASSRSAATAIAAINLRAVQVSAPSASEAERSAERPATGYSLTGEEVVE
jgi:hypothetical protein